MPSLRLDPITHCIYPHQDQHTLISGYGTVRRPQSACAGRMLIEKLVGIVIDLRL